MPYRRIAGTASRERRLRREQEFRDLMEWTRNRPGGYTGRTGSQDDEVRRRWCSFYGFKFSDMKPRPRYPFHRGDPDPDPPAEENDSDSSKSSSNCSTGSSDNAIMEPDTWATDKGPGRLMVENLENYIVTADQYAYAFHLDGSIDSESDFWSKQQGGMTEIWQSVGLLLEDPEFEEVIRLSVNSGLTNRFPIIYNRLFFT